MKWRAFVDFNSRPGQEPRLVNVKLGWLTNFDRLCTFFQLFPTAYYRSKKWRILKLKYTQTSRKIPRPRSLVLCSKQITYYFDQLYTTSD
jgi:hypothetical protein